MDDKNDSMNECVIEWMKGDKVAAITMPSNTKLKNRLLKLKEQRPDEVDVMINKDGSVFGHVPVKWIKINPSKILSEEEKEKLRNKFVERMFSKEV